MNKTALFLKPVLLFVLSFTLVFISGCASTQDGQGAEGEPWVGELTGMVEADLKMFFSRFEEEGDVYLVKGTFKGDLKDVEGGYGEGKMNAKIEGKVKDGIFNLSMLGIATVSDGQANISGDLIGTLSKTQAFGTYIIKAYDDEGRVFKFSGEWSANKADS